MLNSLLGEVFALNLLWQHPVEFPGTMAAVSLKITSGELQHEL